ncbi:DMT family transporter [Brachybacterium sp. 107]|uniref:DMT family transporter n=1 Tax=Brachybacterium sp. 107 TaxID=3457736 RepID=UPI00403476C2
MAYLYLSVAIIFEVAGTLSLRMATSQPKDEGRLWLLAVLGGYGMAFFALTMTLAEGLALGVAYGIWAATGVALTAILSRILFKEPLTKVMAAGIALIIIGVLMIELGAAH